MAIWVKYKGDHDALADTYLVCAPQDELDAAEAARASGDHPLVLMGRTKLDKASEEPVQDTPIGDFIGKYPPYEGVQLFQMVKAGAEVDAAALAKTPPAPDVPRRRCLRGCGATCPGDDPPHPTLDWGKWYCGECAE